jgi:hypothetical protein
MITVAVHVMNNIRLNAVSGLCYKLLYSASNDFGPMGGGYNYNEYVKRNWGRINSPYRAKLITIFRKNVDDELFFSILDLYEVCRISLCRNCYFCWNSRISKLLIRIKIRGSLHELWQLFFVKIWQCGKWLVCLFV